MPSETNPVVSRYSDHAEAYDSPGNLRSCWGVAAAKVVNAIELRDSYRVVADVGCGTGHALLALAERSRPAFQFLGVEPAAQMRDRAAARTRHLPNVRLIEGTFESIPVPSASIDYLYSIHAFHWATDPAQSAKEIHRVLTDAGEMDLVFVGPRNGFEFNKVTTPVLQRYMGRGYMVAAAKMQRQISKDQASGFFGPLFTGRDVSVTESQETYYDSLDGHWAWRVRIEAHFSKIPEEKRRAFDEEVRTAIAGLSTDQGIPYTIHQLHVKVRA